MTTGLRADQAGSKGGYADPQGARNYMSIGIGNCSRGVFNPLDPQPTHIPQSTHILEQT